MSKLIIQPNTEADVQRFAEEVDIDLKHARYIERMRSRYLAWEHGYVKEPKTSKKRRIKTP